MSEFDPIAYMESKGFKGKPSKGGAEFVFPCFFGCNQSVSTRPRDWRLYINTTDAWFHCFRCDSNGGSYLLRKHFGDLDDVPADERTFGSMRRREILEQATQRAHLALMNSDDHLLMLLDRGLSMEVIEQRRLGWVGARWSLTADLGASAEELEKTGLVNLNNGRDFFYNHLMIPYISLGTVVQLRGKCLAGNAAGRYMTGPNESVRLYNADDAFSADEVIVTEGEFDAMMLKQVLSTAKDDRVRRIAVVGLAGVNSIPEEFDRAMENVRRVYLGFDSDDTGKAAAVKYREKYGSRFRIVELPEPIKGKKCDWNEYLLPEPEDADEKWHEEHPHHGHGVGDVMNLIGDAGGRRVYSIGEISARWRTQRTLTGGITLGFDQLDRTIAPGLLPGQIFIILAKTGAGKTVFLANLAYHMRNRPVLWVSLEMTSVECYERLRRIYLFHYPTASDAEVDAAFAQMMICDENRLNEEDMADLIAEFELEKGCKPEVIYVDYLGYYARGVNGRSPYEKTSNAVMSLKGEAKKHNTIIVVPHQVSRQGKEGRPLAMEDARDSGVVEETGDFVMSLYRPGEAQEENNNKEPDGKVRSTLLKSRHGGKGKSFSFQFDLLTLAMVEANTPEATRAAKHTHDYWRGVTYEDLRRAQTRPVQTTMGEN